jgi:hypothetical protein
MFKIGEDIYGRIYAQNKIIYHINLHKISSQVRKARLSVGFWWVDSNVNMRERLWENLGSTQDYHIRKFRVLETTYISSWQLKG